MWGEHTQSSGARDLFSLFCQHLSKLWTLLAAAILKLLNSSSVLLKTVIFSLIFFFNLQLRGYFKLTFIFFAAFSKNYLNDLQQSGHGERGSRADLSHVENTAVLKAVLPNSIRIFSLLLISWGARKISLELAKCKILTLLS